MSAWVIIVWDDCMRKLIGFRTILWALILSIVAAAILLLGTIFNVWASNSVFYIPLLVLFAMPLSFMLFVYLVHHEQEQAKKVQQEDRSRHEIEPSEIQSN